MDQRLHQAMQQLLRYGAFAQLLTSLQTLTTVEAAADALARQWKFCANVGDWRFVSMVEREALRIDGGRGKACVLRLHPSDLLPWELLHAGPSASTRPPVRDGSDPLATISAQWVGPDMPERMVLPVRVGGRSLGAFFVGSENARLDALDRKFIELVASLFAARVTDLLRQEAETAALRRQSTVDTLTQLANGRQFDARLDIEWLQAARAERPLALVVVDVDFFKRYNDCYGHPQGDACLRSVAALLQAAVRPTDLAARVGGEEFCILLPGVTSPEASIVAERARAAVVHAALPHEDSPVAPHVTISLGVASTVPEVDAPPAALYACADQALYAAKRAGRNRWAVKEFP